MCQCYKKSVCILEHANLYAVHITDAYVIWLCLQESCTVKYYGCTTNVSTLLTQVINKLTDLYNGWITNVSALRICKWASMTSHIHPHRHPQYLKRIVTDVFWMP